MNQATRSQPSSMLLALATMSCRDGAPQLGSDELAKHLETLSGWQHKGDRIERTYAFANYYETMAFVNALAWISHREDHHPDRLQAASGLARSDITNRLRGESSGAFSVFGREAGGLASVL